MWPLWLWHSLCLLQHVHATKCDDYFLHLPHCYNNPAPWKQTQQSKRQLHPGYSMYNHILLCHHYCAAQAQVPLICQINPPIHLPVHLFSPIRHRASFQIKIHNMRHLAASCSSWLGSKFQTKNLNFWGYFMSIVTQKVQLWFQKCQVVVIIRSGEKKLSTNSRLHRSEIWWHFVRPFACNPITSARKGRGGA